ncbi:uncharacterized protein LOC112569063 isoform X2 [Pomacea canaliculata]|uniref:uncharacterized protein LOC112569063 isoform X2 n=1 Tax=Pomacea canaliculata TaxID=400727 RepID=UPI000D73BC8F|nr:uncharacterized protein LOC112569063 isoform X2 [Pomacea canaliculata]
MSVRQMVLELYRPASARRTEKKYIMNLSRIVILLLGFCTSVDLLGIETICPTLINGDNSVICKINRTAVEVAQCESVQDYVTLEKTKPSRRNPLVIGFTKSFIPSDCRSRQNPVPDGCWCNEYNREIFEYKCAFVASLIEDTSAQVECKICNSPKNAFEVKVNDNCRSMRFDNGGNGNADYSSEILVFASILGFLISVPALCERIFL